MKVRGLATAACFVALVASCKHDEATPAPPARAAGGGGGAGARGGGAAFAVDVMPVEARLVAYVVQAPGTLDAFERVQVTARVAGTVDKVLFTEGQNVKKGDTLVVIDSERFQLDGTIQTRTVETGQYVTTGYLMATLLRADPMLLRFQVEPQDAPRLKPAMAVQFTMRETEASYTAKITLVAASADPATHTVGITAQVDVDNKKYWLRPGSFCDVSVDVGAGRQAPVIPRLATRATDHGYVVYVVEGSTALEKVVTLGMNTKDGWVEVRSGLAAGELLVVRGVEALANGAHVTASKVDSLDASAPETPLAPGDGGARAGGAAGGKRTRDAGAAP